MKRSLSSSTRVSWDRTGWGGRVQGTYVKRSLSSSTRVSWDRTGWGGRVQRDVREEVAVQQHPSQLGQDGEGRGGRVQGDVREEVAVQQHLDGLSELGGTDALLRRQQSHIQRRVSEPAAVPRGAVHLQTDLCPATT